MYSLVTLTNIWFDIKICYLALDSHKCVVVQNNKKKISLPGNLSIFSSLCLFFLHISSETGLSQRTFVGKRTDQSVSDILDSGNEAKPSLQLP